MHWPNIPDEAFFATGMILLSIARFMVLGAT